MSSGPRRIAARQFQRLVIAAVAAGMLGSIVGTRAEDQALAGDATNGKRVYMADGCFECHGRVGQGGAFLGPAPLIAHTGLPFEAFAQQLREPSNNMPAYAEGVLSDEDAADIYAYVQSLPGPREAKDLPTILTH